jgi:toxin ParE1/3/4
MAYRVVWSRRAVDDLEAIALYVSTDSLAYASAVVRSILNTTRKLSTFPHAGRVVPELADNNIRELFAYSYRIIYRVQDGIVTVAAIAHVKQELRLE